MGTEGPQSQQIQIQRTSLYMTESFPNSSQRSLPTGAFAHTGGTEILTSPVLGG